MRHLLFRRDVFLSTVFVFLVMWGLKLFIFNIHFLSPVSEALRDFELTDIVYSRLQKKSDAVDTNIILINIGNNNRKEIAEQLQTVLKFKPAVIGMDVVFARARENAADSALAAVMASAPSLVLADYFEYSDGRDGQEFDSLVSTLPMIAGNHNRGFVNFLSEGEESIIRHYILEAEHDEKIHRSFSLELLRKFDEQAAAEALSRGKTGIINFQGTQSSYVCFDTHEITDSNPSLAILENKIVIFGFLGPDLNTAVLEDMHFTPLNHKYSGKSFPDMYGVVVHANILSMMLARDYIYKVPAWLMLIFSFIICYIHMVFFIHYYLHRHIWFHLFFKTVQLISSIIIAGIAVLLFSESGISINTGILLIPVVLSVDLLYFYDGIVKALHKKTGFKTLFTGHETKH